MRRIIILLALITSSIGSAQGLKTIYANDNQVVSLFFPNDIRQAVVGSEKFIFSYNREIPQKIWAATRCLRKEKQSIGNNPKW